MSGTETRWRVWRVWNGWEPVGEPHPTREEAEEHAESLNRELEAMGSTLRLTVRPEEEQSA